MVQSASPRLRAAKRRWQGNAGQDSRHAWHFVLVKSAIFRKIG
jgi:hypothetical protein